MHNSAAVYLLILAVVVLFYMGSRLKRQRTSIEALAESTEAGLTEPSTLHPEINLNRCVGSGSCVPACPENALGMIGGKAVLINPTVCIGHGACERACPHNAITLVFGTEHRGMDIPQVDTHFETNVRGIFIAGELGGMGLLHKAAEQGSRAIATIAERKSGKHPYDVVIVGAGPAGLTATLGAIEHKLRYVTIEQESSLGGAIFQYPRNKIAMTTPARLPIVGPMHFREVSKERLLEFWLEAAERAGVKLNYGERMEDVSRIDGGFIVKTTKGAYQTGVVLLAIGRRGTPRKLGVPGEDLPKVVYRLIDPEQYIGQHVLVVGGGDSALEAAIAIAGQPGTTVTLSYRGEAFGRGKPQNRVRLREMTDQSRITVLLKSNVKQVEKSRVVLDHEGALLNLPNDAVIVCAGGVLPTPFLKQIGVMVETKYGTA